MRLYGLFWIAILGAACAGDGATRAADAGAPADAAPDATTCSVSTFYGDRDGDGYGSPDLIAVDCAAPIGFVDNDQDCDDGDMRNRPGAKEYCDGIDNDCNLGTGEVCPLNCLPHLRTLPEGTLSYLFCNTGAVHAAALSTCASEDMELVRIDDQAEQDYLSNQRIPAFGGRPEVWLGGSDLVENDWVWADGTSFWLGRSNGSAVGGRYAFWNGGEPNDDGNEDCAVMREGTPGTWDDHECNQLHRFVCQRTPPP